MVESNQKATKQNTMEVASHAFGTFGGVFTPSILTILGVIMFMRTNFVVGQAGVLAALAILVIAKSITFLTGLSISGISTNTRVAGGGAYFLISRSLGPEFGGAIGLTLFFAQALSVPFYVLGFVEALVRSFPGLQGYFLALTLATTGVIFIVTYVGTHLAIRVQYVILAVLVASVVVFLIGGLQHWNSATFASNLRPSYTGSEYRFWVIFAIYFPAVTGIMAGVNMSGDLKEPARSIPRGTLAAIGTGFAIYALQILVAGGSYTRSAMVERPFELLIENALFGLSFMIIGGVFSATLSSAIGSFMGAPRILQALARDRIFMPLSPFAKGSRERDEPRRGLWLTLAITIGVLLYSGNDVGGSSLNVIAALISMFFLYAYGITNLAAFVESFTANPSFRPRFRLFHWTTALAGTIGCITTAVLIDPLAALVASVIIGSLALVVRRRVLSTTFGDARRGFYYTRVRNNLLALAEQPNHAKNWRPTLLVLSGNPNARLTLAGYALWFGSHRGMVTLAELLIGELEELAPRRLTALRRLEEFINEHDLEAFPEVAVAPDFDQGVMMLLQTHSIGPIKPNVMLLGWPEDPERIQPFGQLLRAIDKLGKSLVCVVDRGLPSGLVSRQTTISRRADVWWYGARNGSLMLLLAHLLTLNWEWSQTQIRLKRVVEEEMGRTPATEALHELAQAARIDAQVEVVVSAQPFAEILHEHSQDADVVFLGLWIPDASQAEELHREYTELCEGLPTTLLVYSSGEADMMT